MIIEAVLAVTLVANGRPGPPFVFLDAGVIETGPGCFVCQIVLRTWPGGDILEVQELTIEGFRPAVLDWYERAGRARIKYRLKCEVKDGRESAFVSVKVDAQNNSRSSSGVSYSGSVPIERSRED